MKDRSGENLKGRWCTVHRTHDIWVYEPCAYCNHEMHFHSGQVKLARRGIAQSISCGRCRHWSRLVVAFDGKRVVLTVQEDGSPVLQGKLPLKTR